jgi:predicted lipoprotein with Yx(FWY)xxD motif
MRIRWWAAPGAVAAVAFLAACGSSPASGSGSGSGSSSPAASSASSAAAAATSPSTSAAGITTGSTPNGKILVTAQGFTIYEFAIDTPTKSNCDATCLQYWPPLTGTPSAASGAGLTGTFGTIKGTGGITQATYDGHPLYLFVKDTKPGMLSGNGLNLSGGKWWALTPSGGELAAAKSGASSSTGGGYGY